MGSGCDLASSPPSLVRYSKWTSRCLRQRVDYIRQPNDVCTVHGYSKPQRKIPVSEYGKSHRGVSKVTTAA
jgi:hypothetical protein